MADGADFQETLYPVVLAATNQRCLTYFNKVNSLLAGTDVWILTGNSKLYARIGEASSLLIRSAAHVHRDVFSKHRQCPVATFKLLYDKAFAYVFHQIRWCLLDSFSWHFREAFPTISDLQSDVAEATLAGVAAIQRVDTIPNECIFAGVH